MEKAPVRARLPQRSLKEEQAAVPKESPQIAVHTLSRKRERERKERKKAENKRGEKGAILSKREKKHTTGSGLAPMHYVSSPVRSC